MMSDAVIDLVEQGLNAALRIGELGDTSTLVARRVGTTTRVTVGSPACFARFGEPATPATRAAHNFSAIFAPG